MADPDRPLDEDRVVIRAKISDNVVKYHLLSVVVALGLPIVTIPLLIVALPIVWLFTTLHYKHLSCELTETAVKVNKGVLNKVEKTIPLEKITDVAFFQGPIMRYMNIDGLRVETAGQSGTGSLVNLMGVDNSRAFRDAVLTQKDVVLGRKGMPTPSGSSGVETGAGAGGSAELSEIRDILLRIEEKLHESKP